jgi:hypothetical protein
MRTLTLVEIDREMAARPEVAAVLHTFQMPLGIRRAATMSPWNDVLGSLLDLSEVELHEGNRWV